MCNTSEHVCWLVRTPLTATWGHVFLLDHQFVFLDLGLLEGSFFFLFWGALVGHTLVCSVPGGDHYFFFSCPSFCFFCSFSLGVSSLRGCVEIFGYWWASPRHHATTQIDTNTNRTVRASRPVLTSPFRDVICLIIRVLSSHGSIYSNKTFSYLFGMEWQSLK